MPAKDKLEEKQRADRQWIEGLLVSAQKRNWYGDLHIKFKRGMVDIVSANKTMKPPSAQIGKEEGLTFEESSV